MDPQGVFWFWANLQSLFEARIENEAFPGIQAGITLFPQRVDVQVI